jgi:hypothetical protein
MTAAFPHRDPHHLGEQRLDRVTDPGVPRDSGGERAAVPVEPDRVGLGCGQLTQYLLDLLTDIPRFASRSRHASGRHTATPLAIANAEVKTLVVTVAPAFQAHMLAAQNLEKQLAQK